jgi:hypothetical protein
MARKVKTRRIVVMSRSLGAVHFECVGSTGCRLNHFQIESLGVFLSQPARWVLTAVRIEPAHAANGAALRQAIAFGRENLRGNAECSGGV